MKEGFEIRWRPNGRIWLDIRKAFPASDAWCKKLVRKAIMQCDNPPEVCRQLAAILHDWLRETELEIKVMGEDHVAWCVKVQEVRRVHNLALYEATERPWTSAEQKRAYRKIVRERKRAFTQLAKEECAWEGQTKQLTQRQKKLAGNIAVFEDAGRL